MANGKEIRTQIQSIKSTQKITRAMEMEAAGKMRKAQLQMRRSEPYAKKIQTVISHLSKSQPEYRHPFMVTRPIKKVGVLIVSSDRGFCGGLNINLFRHVLKQLRQWDANTIPVDVALIGRKAESFFRRLPVNIVGHVSQLGETPALKDLLGVVTVMLNAYQSGEIDALYIAHNVFVNTMKQEPVLQPLLPLQPLNDIQMTKTPWDYLYEPDAKELLHVLLTRFIESQIYQAVVDNLASEQASRMVAMKNATENAGNLIDDLQLVYNKARQAAITQELSEIVAGANAV